MREILFRAKRKDNGKWVYGDLLHPDLYGNSYAIEDFTKGKNNCFDIDENTICEYTNLKDKNGTKIFESDIILFEDESPMNYEYHDCTEMRCGVIEFSGGEFYLTNRIAVSMDDLIYDETLEGQVIGNKFDNPELLEGAR